MKWIQFQSKDRYQPECSHRSGFTLLELVVVLGVAAVLVALLLPSLAGAKTDGQTFQCLNNHRQLILAWRVYVEDNNDYLAANDYYSGGTIPAGPPFFASRGSASWVPGLMTYQPGNTDNTNTALLIGSIPTSLGVTGGSQVGPYAKDPSLFHCPADKSFMPGQGKRVRSVSMNSAVGTKWNTAGASNRSMGVVPVDRLWLDGNYGTGQSHYWLTFNTMTLVNTKPGPANLWVLLDEHPDSISDSVFSVGIGNPTNRSITIVDTPASYHNGAGSFAFADGHCESHKWIGSTIKKPEPNPGFPANGYAAGDSLPDLQWLQDHTTAAK